jgi:hypothetical protein
MTAHAGGAASPGAAGHSEAYAEPHGASGGVAADSAWGVWAGGVGMVQEGEA